MSAGERALERVSLRGADSWARDHPLACPWRKWPLRREPPVSSCDVPRSEDTEESEAMTVSELEGAAGAGRPDTAPESPEAGSGTPTARRAVVSGALGSALEWFDFSVYGALSATVFPQLFFP